MRQFQIEDWNNNKTYLKYSFFSLYKKIFVPFVAESFEWIQGYF